MGIWHLVINCGTNSKRFISLRSTYLPEIRKNTCFWFHCGPLILLRSSHNPINQSQSPFGGMVQYHRDSFTNSKVIVWTQGKCTFLVPFWPLNSEKFVFTPKINLSDHLWNNIIDIFIVKFYEMLVLGPYFAHNSKTVGTITTKFNTNLPFVVWNLVIRSTNLYSSYRPKTKCLRTTTGTTTEPYQYMTANILRSYKNISKRRIVQQVTNHRYIKFVDFATGPFPGYETYF